VATRRRRADKVSDQQLQKSLPSARTIARLMITARDHLAKPTSVMIGGHRGRFTAWWTLATSSIDFSIDLIRTKTDADLEQWIVDAKPSLGRVIRIGH